VGFAHISVEEDVSEFCWIGVAERSDVLGYEVFEAAGNFGLMLNEVKNEISGSEFDDTEDVAVLIEKRWGTHRTLNVGLVHFATNPGTISGRLGTDRGTVGFGETTEGTVDKASDVSLSQVLHTRDLAIRDEKTKAIGAGMIEAVVP